MMGRKVTLHTGISAELLNAFCKLTYHCHVLMYNHFAATLGNLGFLGTGECEKMRCGTNTQEVVKTSGEDVFVKAKAQVEQLSSSLVLTASGRDIWGSKKELLKHMQNHVGLWPETNVVTMKDSYMQS